MNKTIVLEPGHPCPTCGHVISNQLEPPKVEFEKHHSKSKERRGSKNTFEFCDGPLGMMIAPVIDPPTERRDSSTSTRSHGQEDDGGKGYNYGKRNSLTNFIRRLSAPFTEEVNFELDPDKLARRRESRGETFGVKH